MILCRPITKTARRPQICGETSTNIGVGGVTAEQRGHADAKV